MCNSAFASMRASALAYLPALLAALMLVSGSASAMPLMAALCNGGAAALPGKAPRRDCDQACHVGCTRRKAKA
jgi:hypothetical protein